MKKILTFGLIFSLCCLHMASGAENCIKGNDNITVSGTIHMRTLAPDLELSRTKSWTYPVITFDHPICVKDEDFGDVPNGKVASVIFTTATTPSFKEGQHVRLQGRLAPPDNGNQPPEPLMLVVSEKP
jgi:hypothetical protein